MFRMINNQSGQGLIEYVLLLVVAVGIILGSIYQLNSAFKVWATNYFGNYLACILETGELPSLGGGSGGTGLCEQIFKPFNIADGRRLIDGFKPGAGGGSTGNTGGGTRESSGSSGGSYYSQGYQGTPFRSSITRSSSKAAGLSRRKGSSGSTYTGSTQVSSYGSDYNRGRSSAQSGSSSRLDNSFAFQDEKEEKQKRKASPVTKKSVVEGNGRAKRIPYKGIVRKTASTGPDSSLTFTNFIRYLIIAAIIIALVLFLGGQALNIGKSMER